MPTQEFVCHHLHTQQVWAGRWELSSWSTVGAWTLPGPARPGGGKRAPHGQPWGCCPYSLDWGIAPYPRDKNDHLKIRTWIYSLLWSQRPGPALLFVLLVQRCCCVAWHTAASPRWAQKTAADFTNALVRCTAVPKLNRSCWAARWVTVPVRPEGFQECSWCLFCCTW